MKNLYKHKYENTDIQKTLDNLRQKDSIVEIRMLTKKNGTVSGYFDNDKNIMESVYQYIGKNDIYISLNPPKDDLIARRHNRLDVFVKQTTTDTEIKQIHYILIDIDPMRPSGISSTAEEKAEAYKVIERIEQDLKEKGFPEGILCDSGNGYHLLLPVELENVKENVQLIKRFLETLDFLHSNQYAKVDVVTYNPARIVKLYGTTACKGDDTKERPHRLSKICSVPSEKKIVEKSLLESYATNISKLQPEKNTAKKNFKGMSFDVKNFIEKHQLGDSKGQPYNNNATKYILDICPWNNSHTNRSAFIIQFEDGGIAAGCLHDSCSHENWYTLKKLLGEDTSESSKKKKEAKEVSERQVDVIIEQTVDFEFFTDELEEPYAAMPIDEHVEVYPLNSKKFKLYLTKLYYEEIGTPPNPDCLIQAIRHLESIALFSDNKHKLQKRIASHQDCYYYDLCNSKWEVVKISDTACEIDKKPPILFSRNKNMQEQVPPDFSVEPTELYRIVKKHFLLKSERDTILLTIYLVICFISNISHPLLVIYGEKGAAKSTTMRMIKRIVDPAKQDLLTLPTSKTDLAISLSNNYMPCFDNLDSISAEKSDMLCMAATGGAFTKRTLYSDSDETILQFKRSVCLNGINVVATRPDLLDRSILLELERISKKDRKTEKIIWNAFEADLPKILGAIFNTISKAMPLYGTKELDEVGRMADFTYWGYAVASVLGFGGERFLDIYLSNQSTANQETLESHPIALALLSFMKNIPSWTGSISVLFQKLEQTAYTECINTNAKLWAKDPKGLSRRLKEIQSNLEEVGILFSIRNAGVYKEIKLTKSGAEHTTFEAIDELAEIENDVFEKFKTQVQERYKNDSEEQ